MPLHSTAQMMETIEVADAADVLPIVMYSAKPSPEVVMEMHDPDFQSQLTEPQENLDVSDSDGPIVVEDLPGVKALDPELEEALEVNDEPSPLSNQTQHVVDKNDAKKSKKDPKWDWEAHGPHGFVAWIKGRLTEIPKHSGYDSAGIERAMSFLERLDNEISKAMRLDLDGELDANKIEEARSQIDDGIDRLNDRLEKVRAKKGKKKKKANEDTGLVKEAQKATNISGIVITVDLLISRIARVCINGMVSAGHDIEDLFQRQAEYYNLDKREKAMAMQLLADMGYPLRQDRGLPVDEDVDTTSSDNMDWAANYQA